MRLGLAAALCLLAVAGCSDEPPVVGQCSATITKTVIDYIDVDGRAHAEPVPGAAVRYTWTVDVGEGKSSVLFDIEPPAGWVAADASDITLRAWGIHPPRPTEPSARAAWTRQHSAPVSAAVTPSPPRVCTGSGDAGAVVPTR